MLKTLFEASPLAIIVSGPDGAVEALNPAAERLFGWREEELLGHPLPFFPPEKEGEREELVHRVLHGEEVVGFETYRLRKDGSQVEVSLSGIPLRDAEGRVRNFVAFVEDISDRKAAERRLRESEWLLAAAMESIHDYGISILDAGGVIRFWNAGAENATGYSRDDAIGRHFSLVYRQEDIDARVPDREMEEADETGKAEREGWRVRKDGSLYWDFQVLTRIEVDGQTAGFVKVAKDQTERRKAEEALRESERRLSTLISNLPGIAYRCRNDPSWSMEFVSRGVLEMVGYPPEDFTSGAISWADLIHPDHRDLVWERIQAAVARREPFQLEYRIRSRTGEDKWVWEQGRGIFHADGRLTALEGLISDVTSQRNAEEERRILAAAIEKLPDTVAVLNPDETIRSVNPAVERLLGYSPRELIGQPAAIGSVAPDEAFWQVVRTRGWTGERQGKHKDGSEVPVHVTAAPVHEESGRVIGIVAIARDLREEKERQERLKEADRLTSIGYLAAGVAHEVNNPLAAISNFAELLLMEPLSKEMRDDVSAIVAESRRAGTIVRNLLAFARKSVPEKRSTDLRAVIESVLKLKGHQLRAANISVEFDLDASAPPVLVDPHQVQQVLHNLLTNARQAIQHAYDEGTIRVRLGQVEGAVEVVLEDTGTGIPSEVLPKIFTPFFTTKPVGEGTGMGLPIVYGIVQEHGGVVRAGNWGRPPVAGGAVGEGGARFVLRLPVGSEDSAPTRLADPHAPGPKHVAKRCLVVEDEPLLALSAQKFLTRRGFQVEIALRAEDGLERILQGEPFDAILSDFKMPGLGGEGLYHRLREERPEALSSLAFTSGDISTEETHRFLEMSGCPVLPKPYALAELEELILKVIEKTRG